jgi:hypothetical protein
MYGFLTSFAALFPSQKLWDEKHQDGAKKLADIITELKGFYVKTGA